MKETPLTDLLGRKERSMLGSAHISVCQVPASFWVLVRQGWNKRREWQEDKGRLREIAPTGILGSLPLTVLGGEKYIQRLSVQTVPRKTLHSPYCL